MRLCRALLILVALLGGCVYYNGMYNARRLSGAAQKAEREGRSIEADNYWGQVVVKADTLLARHPGSKWAVEASALRGRALARLGQCGAAVPSLIDALPNLVDSAFAYDAEVDLATCRMQLGEYAVAAGDFARLEQRGSPSQRSETRLLRARALRLSGNGTGALAILDSLGHPRARGERLAALAVADRREALLELADSLLAAGDTVAPWDSALAAISRADAPTASAFVDRMRRLSRGTPDVQARWLLDDARRLATVDAVRAESRLVAAESVAVGGDAGQRARLERIRLALRRAGSPDDLIPHILVLDTLTRTSSAAAEATILRSVAARVRTFADTSAGPAGQGDLALFVVAEAARDSLESPGIAAWLFRRVAARWPSSPFAPKALLAAASLVPGDVAELERLLDQQYADNPYVVAWHGMDTPGLQVLEDSLAAFQIAMTAAAAPAADSAPTPRRPARPRPGASTRPEP